MTKRRGMQMDGTLENRRGFGKIRFTLIELLTVVAVILILIAMLLPSLERARYAGMQVVCISNVKQQYQGLIVYAGANDRRYPSHRGTNPDRLCDNSAQSFDVSIAGSLRGTYITDSEVMLCPISANYKESYASNDWGNSSYGGWDTNASSILGPYIWMVNYRSYIGGTARVSTEQYFEGEPRPVGKMSETTVEHTFITHESSQQNPGSGVNAAMAGHNYLWPDVSSFSTPIWVTDVPVVFGDGSGIYRRNAEIKKRFSHSTTGTPAYREYYW